jgi:hypothetical protein
MRFAKHGDNQWVLQLTYAWEVDMLSKLPENEWVPLKYEGEQRTIGAIHVGSLAVRFIDGRPIDPERPFVIACPLSQFPRIFSLPTSPELYISET